MALTMEQVGMVFICEQQGSSRLSVRRLRELRRWLAAALQVTGPVMLGVGSVLCLDDKGRTMYYQPWGAYVSVGVEITHQMWFDKDVVAAAEFLGIPLANTVQVPSECEGSMPVWLEPGGG